MLHDTQGCHPPLLYHNKGGKCNMPAVIPLGESAKNRKRWEMADEGFADQIAVFLRRTRMTKKELASRLEVSTPTINYWMNDPGSMKKAYERKLVTLFEEHGMHYNPMLDKPDIGCTW